VLVQCAREHLPDSPLRVIMWKSPWSHLPVNEKNPFPSHPFWDYSLQLYGRPGVEAACLTLQDEFDLDVNIVLFCLWAGAAGPGRLTAEEISECITRGGRWQREVVQRLRHIRRTLKHDALGATPPLVEVFRPRAQNLELAAEHAQQLLLASIVPESRGVVDSSAAVDNLRAYFNETGLAADGNVREAVLIILNQAFADMDPIDIEALWTA
jgi:uncharacterized protein (TIGR02444 family)